MTEIDTAVAMGVEDILSGISTEERQALFQSLDVFFRTKTRKKTSHDLEAKIEGFSNRILKLSTSLKIKLDGNRVIILSDDRYDMETLEFLERGSEWFEGRDIGTVILDSLLNTSS